MKKREPMRTLKSGKENLRDNFRQIFSFELKDND